MIYEFLITQINARFQYEKRAQVCLWFDEKQEFKRLMPGFRSYLSGLKKPSFILLEYDPAKKHGQIWIKYSIHTTLKSLKDKERKKQRFVVYLPLAEDRLESADETGKNNLELLTEYKIAGVLWRVGGKKPTLFSFLRQAGVHLPLNPSEQRKLWEGGADSLLSKFMAKFSDRPAVFWSKPITVDNAQSMLLGDLDQMILDIAVGPEATVYDIQERGLQDEFHKSVAERYGFHHEHSQTPSDWIKQFVTVLALTETFLGYGEADDFPFKDRLPPVSLHHHHRELLSRWLRDTENRTAWDRLIGQVEADIDLSGWAKDKVGLSFGFPHLVRQRWDRVITLFKEAADKSSTIREYFKAHGDWIDREADFAKASHTPAGSWELLRRLGRFIAGCEAAESKINECNTAGEAVGLYLKNSPLIDSEHLLILKDADEQGLPLIARVAGSAYAQYVKMLNDRFFNAYTEQSDKDIENVPHVTATLEEKVWSASGKRAVIIVDAFRYDCAISVKEALQGHAVSIEAMRAEIPTITPMGMAALLPISKSKKGFKIISGYPHPLVNGLDMAQRKHRIEFLEKIGAHCLDIEAVESLAEFPLIAGDLLVVFGHDAVDQLGHGSADTIVRHMDLEIQRIVRLIRKLHRWGFETVHVLTDHGFLLMEDNHLPSGVDCNKNWCVLQKERYALVSASVDVPLKTFPFEWDPELRVALPPGVSFFKAEKSFSHGGASLQELIIPHLISKSSVAQEKRISVEVVLSAYELMQATVRVVLRPVGKGEDANVQMGLFTPKGRTLSIDVYRAKPTGQKSVLPNAQPKKVRLEAADKEKKVSVFLSSGEHFKKGELLDLDIRDDETLEQFPSGGIKLTIGRDM